MTVVVGGGDIAGAGAPKDGQAANWAEPGVKKKGKTKGKDPILTQMQQRLKLIKEK